MSMKPDPVDGPATLRATAAELDAALRAYATEAGLTDSTTAAALLNVTHATLLDMITGGDLSAVILRGSPWVNPAALQVCLLERTERGAASMQRAQSLARTALRGFLQARDVTGDWEQARLDQRPLVCARRGKGWLRYGLGFHSVVINTRWVGQWAGTHGIAETPELAELAVGPYLCALLEDLAGVSAVSSVTPLLGKPKAHSVAGWVRVEPDSWPLTIPAEVTAAVAGPSPDVSP